MEALSEGRRHRGGRDIVGARVAVLGYAYLENSDDTRNSPSAVLVKKLRARGAEVVVHAPYVPEYRGDLLERVQGCDVAVVMVRHEEYRALPAEVLDAPVIVDGRNVVSAVAQRRVGREEGVAFRSLGRG